MTFTDEAAATHTGSGNGYRTAVETLEAALPDGWSAEVVRLPSRGRWVAWAHRDEAEWDDCVAFADTKPEAMVVLALSLQSRGRSAAQDLDRPA